MSYYSYHDPEYYSYGNELLTPPPRRRANLIMDRSPPLDHHKSQQGQELRRRSVPAVLPARASSNRLSPSRLSPRMACVPEDEFTILSPDDSCGRSTSGESSGSPLDGDGSNRPRVFSFPSSDALKKENIKQFNQVANWNRDQWTPIRKRKDSPEQTAMSLAEREFLTKTDTRTYQRIRSFKSTKRGQLVDCGYCYRRHASPETERSREPLLVVEPTHVPTLATRRMTCPEIWLSRAESFTPKIDKYEILVIGSSNVGKSTIIRQLIKEGENDTESMEGGQDANSDTVTFLLNKHEVQLTFTDTLDLESTQEREPDPEVRQIAVGVYNVTNRPSFRLVGKVLYSLYEERTNRDKEDRLMAVLVGNKMDLERKRKVKESEGRTMSRIYRCPFLETSASLSLHTERLLKELLRIIHRQHEEEEKEDDNMAIGEGLQGRRDSAGHRFLQHLRDNGRRLARSCEELFSKIKL